MESKIKSFLQRVDAFGTKITLKYNKRSSYRTTFGGVITILLVILILTVLIQQLISMILRMFNDILFKKENIKYSSSVNYSNSPEILEVGDENFMIAVRYNQEKNFLTRPMINVTFETRHYYRTENGTHIKVKTPVQLEPCTLDHFKNVPHTQSDWEDQFKSLGLNDYLCLQRGQKYQIGGMFENKDFYHLKFQLKSCVNTTNQSEHWQPVCDTPENINKSMDLNSRINIVFTNYILNPQKPNDPVVQFLQSNIYTIQTQKMYLATNIYLNEQIMITDNSIWPISDLKEDNFIVFSQGDSQDSVIVGDFPVLNEVYFLRSCFTTTHYKSFTKAGDIISFIGGFANVFLVISTLTIHFYNKFVYTVELANRLYDFDIQRDSKKILFRQNATIYNPDSPLKSKASDGKIISREDYGLAPLEDIQRILIENNPELERQRSSFFFQSQRLQNENNNGMHSSQRGSQFLKFEKQEQQYQQSRFYETPETQCMKKQDTDENQFSLDQNQNQIGFNYRYTEQFKSLKDEKETTYENQLTIKDQITNPEFYQSDATGNPQGLNIVHQLSNNNQEQSNSIQNMDSGGKNQSSNINFVNSQLINFYQKKKNLEQIGVSDTQQFLKNEIDFIAKRDRSLKLTFRFVFNKITCKKYCNTREVKFLRKAETMIQKDLDVFVLLEKVKQLEKFKKLFLSTQQETIFNFFPKPLIQIKTQEQEMNLEQMKHKSILNDKQQKKLQQKAAKNLKLHDNNLKKMVTSVYNKFKTSTQNQLDDYQNLFSCYERLQKLHRTKEEEYLNKKLVDLLGAEMKTIFKIADLQINNLILVNYKQFNLKQRMNQQQQRSLPPSSLIGLKQNKQNKRIKLKQVILNNEELQTIEQIEKTEIKEEDHSKQEKINKIDSSGELEEEVELNKISAHLNGIPIHNNDIEQLNIDTQN